MRRLRVRSLSLSLGTGDIVSLLGISSSVRRRPVDMRWSIPGLECLEDGEIVGSKRWWFSLLAGGVDEARFPRASTIANLLWRGVVGEAILEASPESGSD